MTCINFDVHKFIYPFFLCKHLMCIHFLTSSIFWHASIFDMHPFLRFWQASFWYASFLTCIILTCIILACIKFMNTQKSTKNKNHQKQKQPKTTKNKNHQKWKLWCIKFYACINLMVRKFYKTWKLWKFGKHEIWRKRENVKIWKKVKIWEKKRKKSEKKVRKKWKKVKKMWKKW